MLDDSFRKICSALAFAACAGGAQGVAAQGDVDGGLRLYQEKGACHACHGWAGDGRKTDNQMPDGANLRETALDRAMLVTVIKCGRPHTGMPPYDRLAYSDGRCYGMKQADLAKLGIRMGDPPATLQAREVDAIVDFLLARVVGKGPMDSRAKCVEFWGGEGGACAEFAK